MRVLVGCEFSGVVRDAFIARGHNAISCDVLPSERPGPHIQDDICEVCDDTSFDLFIAFPPCTHLTVAGAWRWQYTPEQDEAARFVLHLAGSPIQRIAIENPPGVLSWRWRKPDQIIQPYWFGHSYSKRTCLWLENLPPLQATNIVPYQTGWTERFSPSPRRGLERSKTPQGLADAMAQQWG